MTEKLATIRQNMQLILFSILYAAVTLATFRHSAYGFASVEGGSFWWGALSALAVDAGMIFSATFLRRERNIWLVALLFSSAFASIFTQVLYTTINAPAVEVGAGALWMGDYAVWLINLRVLILAVFLPVSAVFCAFAAKSGEQAKAPDLDAKVVEILAQGLGKKATAAAIWELSMNGYREFTAVEVATMVGCSPRTAQSAKPEN